jgi:hypothetical protein
MKMKNLLLAVLAFGLLSSSAFAQEGLEKRQITRVVASGTNQRIGFFTALNPDLPYYDPTISEVAVAGLNRFARASGLLQQSAPYDRVVAMEFRHLWTA